jgi:ADP-ribose pyrophosphatase YjhB (NUDIX family)
MSDSPTQVVSAAIFDGERVLLIQRGKFPYKGKWSLPGGRVENGESHDQAIQREIREETGLEITKFLPVHIIEFKEPWHQLHVFTGQGPIDEAQALDDAADVRCLKLHEVDQLSTTPDLKKSLIAAWETLQARS